MKTKVRLTQFFHLLPPFLSVHDSMKSFIWFTTILLLCVELAHATHITHVRGHRQHRRAPAIEPTARRLRRRGTRTCTPPTNNTSSNPSNQINAANSGGFPSIGFKMPSSVPSSINGWWSDYKSEIGFLGFSYAVDSCMLLGKSTSDLESNASAAISRPEPCYPKERIQRHPN